MAKPLEYEKSRSGKEVFRTFGPDGSLVSEEHSYGLLDIGISYEFSGGTKIEETYFLKKRLVGRRTYAKGRVKYPDMPKPDPGMEDWGAHILRAATTESKEHRLEFGRHQPDPESAQVKDAFCQERLQQGKTEDAMKWIKARDHTLGERDWAGSNRLVKQLAAAGCVKIWACEIGTCEDGHENTGQLVLKLPKAKAARARVFDKIDRLARGTGYSGPFDDGEQYSYVKLD